MRIIVGGLLALFLFGCGGSSEETTNVAQEFSVKSAALTSKLQGDTFYIRKDGGSATQCTGRANTAYPGTGVGQNCAWRSPHDALPATDVPRIAGGDTLMIESGEYQVGFGAPDAAQGRCYRGGKYDCHLAALPSGPSPDRPTRILGSGYDGACNAPPRLWGSERVQTVLNLADSSNVEIACLDITDKSVCVGNHESDSLRCIRGDAAVYGPYADAGVRAYRSKNVKLRDLTIHGLAYHGIQAGGISDWILERVKLMRNGYAGWDGDLSGISGAGSSSNSGNLVFRNVEIAWNGCAEDPKTGEAVGCYAQQKGGYGDGLGTAATGGQWLFEDVSIHHNTSDGLDMLYLDGLASTKVRLNRVHAHSNAGNQLKVNGNAEITNSVVVGNCGYFYRNAQKYPYMVSGDHCRAGGTGIAIALQTNNTSSLTHNTITGEGDILVFHAARTDREGHPMDDSGAKLELKNNIFYGQTDFTGTGGELVAAHYWEKTKAVAAYSGNLFWNVKSAQCPTGSLCGNPMLVDGILDRFDPHLQATSPAKDRVPAIAEIQTDFYGKKRVSGPAADIGAVEAQSGTDDTPTCTRSAPTVNITQPTGPILPGGSVMLKMTAVNKDTSACGASTFTFTFTVPSGWTAQQDARYIWVAPGVEASSSLTLISPANASGVYNVPAKLTSKYGAIHSVSASAVVQVKPTSDDGGGVLSGGVVTDKVEYTVGETVKIGAAVKRDGKSQLGATVKFSIEGPNGVRWASSTKTDVNGMAWSSYQPGSQSGRYYIYATAEYPNAKGFHERNYFIVK